MSAVYISELTIQVAYLVHDLHDRWNLRPIGGFRETHSIKTHYYLYDVFSLRARESITIEAFRIYKEYGNVVDRCKGIIEKGKL